MRGVPARGSDFRQGPGTPRRKLRRMEETRQSPNGVTPEQVFREYAPRIYHLARRMLGSDADAEDVTQDVLLQVVRKLDTFRGDAALTTWLHKVTVNAALAHRRKRGNRQAHHTGEPLDAVLDDGPASTGPG